MTQTDDTSVRPLPIPFAFKNIPAELKIIPQWVVEWYTLRDKWTKPLFNPRSGDLAKSNDPSTWGDYETAVATYGKGGFDGIGFVLTSDLGVVGVDLDHCIDPQTKTIAQWALNIIDLFNCYVEVSPSGTGLRLFLTGVLPAAGGRKKGNIEIYSSGRYLTTTGRVLKACHVRTLDSRQAEIDAFLAEYFPEPKIEKGAGATANGNGHLSDHEIIEIGFKAKNGDKLRSLLDGNLNGYPSASEAELALCALLAFYTRDASQVDRLYRGSKLYREKWDTKHYGDGATYGRATIEKAISGATETYSAKAETGSEFVSAPKETKRAERIFELQKWKDFVATDHGSAPYTVHEIAPDCGLIALHGRGKGGKTTLLIHGGRAIAGGEPFLERATIKKPVVYLNYEMGFSYLKELLSAGGSCPDEAYILNRPEPVLQTVTVEALMQHVGKPAVMVIDSFRGAFRLAGDAENSAGGAGLILRNIQDLAVKHKWLVIVVHHSNRSSREGTDGVSGTSDWIAAPDVIWTWSRPDKSKPGVLNIEGRMPPVDPLAVDLSPEKCVFAGSVEESQGETDNKAILASLTEEGQASDVIAEMINRPAGTVRKRLEALFAKELVKRGGVGKKGDPFVYSKNSFRTENPLREETNSGREMGDQGEWAKLR